MPDTKVNPNSKSASVIALLKQTKGASLEKLCSETGWQQHSARAFITGFRKKGFTIVHDKDDGGCSIYRITGKATARQKEKRA